MTIKKSVYQHSSSNGMNTHQTEVFELEDGQLEAVFTRLKRKRFPDGTEKYFVDQVSKYTAANKMELRNQDFPKLRETQILLNSDFLRLDHD